MQSSHYPNLKLAVQIAESWNYSPLNDAKEAADEVVKALAERRWRLQ